jgi:hypothetical protein
VAGRGVKRDDTSTRGRKGVEDDEHVPHMNAAIVEATLGVVENGLVAAAGRAATEGNIPGLIALHKHFSRIKSRGAGGRATRRAVPAREELERLDHAFEGCEADPAP